jgi:hypothetical protein
MKILLNFWCSMPVVLVAVLASCQSTTRYTELKRVVNANTGFAHFTRGVNAYTLYALRECVSENDIAVLSEMMNDKDGPTRIAAMYVLADLGESGRKALREAKTDEASSRLEIQDAINESLAPDYRPILQYPMTEAERKRISGCRK